MSPGLNRALRRGTCRGYLGWTSQRGKGNWLNGVFVEVVKDLCDNRGSGRRSVATLADSTGNDVLRVRPGAKANKPRVGFKARSIRCRTRLATNHKVLLVVGRIALEA